MARRNRKDEQPIGAGMTARQFKHKKPINLDYLRKIEPLTENQKKLFEYYEEGKNIFAHGVPGSGKAQPLYSKILTPNGWKTMGEIEIGDEVLTPEGNITKVIGTFPQGEKDIYEIVFHDGSKARCCLEHLWKVHVPYSWTRKKAVPPKIVDTKFLIDFLQEKETRKSNKNISIDLIDPINTPNITLPIDPYIIGCLIGDGCLVSNTPRFTSSDYEIIENIQTKLNEELIIKKINSSKYDYNITDKNAYKNRENSLTKLLKDLLLFNKKSYEKEIPEIYMKSGTEQKMELLRGLLDTDGTVEKTRSNQVSFSTTSKKLAQQVQTLIWSLGGLCTITEKYPTYTHNGEKRTGRLSYRAWIKIKNNSELFKLKRKKDLCRTTYDPHQYRRKIKEINYIGKEEAKCIMIEDDNHLYITDDYTITHNTFILLYNALKEVLNERSPYEKIYIVRSLVQTREIGFMPGSEDDKKSLFEIPYKNMVRYMFEMPSDADFEMLYGNLKAQGTISFWCTSFIRGVTLDNSIIIVDESQNCSAHESFSVISRCGLNTKIMFAGDIEQSDLTRMSEKNGIIDFLKIIDIMPSFEKIEFDVDDIVRSPLVREFVIAKKSLNL